MATKSHAQRTGATSLTDRIFEFLRDQIVNFELKPLHTISEKMIAEKIGVSRTPVREALARLADQGLVDIYPQRGTVVSPLRQADLEHSQFIREALEVSLVQRVAALANRTDLVRKLRAEIALQRTFADISDEHRFYASNEDFHRLITAYAGLPGLYREIERSNIHMDRCRHLALSIVEKDLGAIADHHVAIADAIEAGDADAAAEAMRVDLRRVFKFVGELMDIHPEYFEGPGEKASLAPKLDSTITATDGKSGRM